MDLSSNRLIRLEDAAFATLPNLAVLDLSHNNELELLGRPFIGLENSLIELSLENVSYEIRKLTFQDINSPFNY